VGNLLSSLRARGADAVRSAPSINTISDYLLFMGQTYPLGLNQTLTGKEEGPASGFLGYAALFSSDPVVFAAECIRMQVFSQGRFQWREFVKGRPQAPFGTSSLGLLEKPWRGGRTADLLMKMILQADLAGNAYPLRVDGGKRLSLPRPDWVTLLLGSDLDPEDPATAEDAELVGIAYSPNGQIGRNSRIYLPGEFGHFAPTPDPTANYRGMSWLTPVIREVQADKAATEHKYRFFVNGATPNMVIKHDPSMDIDQIKAFRDLMDEEHRGVLNAYKTLHLGGGADAEVVGKDFRELDFSKTQGKGETRILMAAGVHPTMAGASEGMQGSSLNAGNYSQVRRAFSDIRLQHLWTEACAALEGLVVPPSDGAQLVVDQRDIPFLQDDQKDKAEIQASQARAIRTLVDGGFEAKTAVEAVIANDFGLLSHTGKLSVQLQEPDADDNPEPEGDA
jgi:phage portal protein BeeE